MRKSLLVVLLVLLGTLLANAQNVDSSAKQNASVKDLTREYLLAHGFKQSKEDPDHFEKKQVRLGDVLDDLGLTLKSLRPMMNAPQNGDEDVRTAKGEGMHAVFRGKFANNRGRRIGSAPANPDAVYTVSVSINRPPPRVYLKTDCVPSLSIKSVTIPKAQSEWLHITLELAATGSKPLAIQQKDFKSLLTGSQLPGYSSYGVQFPKETPQIITVLPSKPIVLEIAVPLNASEGVRLVSGEEYIVQIRVSPNKLNDPQSYDYQWRGQQYRSNEFVIVAK